MFIQTEETPDPARLRFLPGREVLATGTLDIRDSEKAAISPLAERLFAIPGVVGVALDRDSVTVARTAGAGDWRYLKPAILGAIMEHFMSGAPTLRREDARSAAAPTAAALDESGTVDRIRAALRQVIDPELGYNIVDLGLVYEITVAPNGGATVVMTTTTPGCPATSYLTAGAGAATGAVEGVAAADIKLTYEPRWTTEMMTAAAKARFGIRDGRRR
jgi:metal-sulfur cluster biosynthetic enzyme